VRIVRALKGLEEMIPESVVHWLMAEDGWTFAEAPGVVPDPIHHARFLREIYTAAKPDYTGRVTVPVLWDKERSTIVNNESSEIIRMLTVAFDDVGARPGDYYPEQLRGEIDQVNARVYDKLNNGVYRAGFATSQTAYEEAVAAVFETLAWLEDRLSRQRYLVGARLTEADFRLFTTLVRFDEVYHGHFKCNYRRLVDYPSLWAFTRDVFQHPGVASTVNIEHIKRHYYQSHRTINPTGIVPVGPSPDFAAPHGRDAFSRSSRTFAATTPGREPSEASRPDHPAGGPETRDQPY
jgi:putative glutathione S-transferase